MRSWYLVLTFALLVPELGAAPVPKPRRPIRDSETILGSWEVVVTQFGEDPPGGENGQVYTFSAGGQAWVQSRLNERATRATITLDETKSPRQYTWTQATGGTWIGVYELDGDRLRFCSRQAGANVERPLALKPAANTEYYEFKRKR